MSFDVGRRARKGDRYRNADCQTSACYREESAWVYSELMTGDNVQPLTTDHM